MPATSEAQRATAAMALAVKSGAKSLQDMPPGARAAIRSMLGMSVSQLRDYAVKAGGRTVATGG